MKSDQRKIDWRTSTERQRLINAAEKAGLVFDRAIKEREEYELRELARKIRTT